MKIVCGSCQAKYSIADEKVAGKVFRIRCKRCGEVIVVRGDQDSPEANATVAAQGNEPSAQAPTAAAAAKPPTDGVWHVVINGEQAGPYSPQQLADLVASGQLDWEAYVWSEGFENWQPMRDVPVLVNAISGGQGVPVTAQPAAAANSQMGADPFPEEAPAQQQVVFAKAAAGGGGVVQTNPRVDTPAALSGFDSGSPGMSATSSAVQGPRVSAQQAMTGARNENSVLFSLKNLQALATGSVPPPSSPSSVRPGHAAGEGSGLIDIRALATTTGVEPNRNSEKDALLALGSAQAGAFGGLGSPMLSPQGKAEDEESKKPLIFAIVGGCALLAVAVIAVALIMRGGSATPVEVTPVGPATAAPPAAAATQPSAAAPVAPAQAEEELSEGEKAARAAAAAKAAEQAAVAAPQDTKSASHAAATSSKRSSGGGSTEKASDPAPAAKAAEPDKPAEKRKSSGSLDDLLNDAIGGKSNSLGAKSSAASTNLPERPSRDDVLKAMKGVADSVKACAPGQSGVAFANVTVIGKTGRVGNADVTGVTGEPAACIARAVRKAVFPKFTAENFQVKFPFRL